VQDAADDIRTLIEGVIAAADLAMYEAKRAGGNQIRQSSAAA
jgi:GGDEF domain-containing protein